MKKRPLAGVRSLRVTGLLGVFAVVGGIALSLGQIGPVLAHDDDGGPPSVSHQHMEKQVVPAAMAPTVRLTMHPEPDNGWYLALATSNFRFAPEHAGGASVMGEGHAHLYLDGKMIDRIYGPAEFMPAMSPGLHTVETDLFTNNHHLYTSDDGKITGDRYVVLVPEKGAFAPINQDHSFRFKGGKLVGASSDDTLRFKKGDGVALRWSTDTPAEIHLHGYNIEVELTPQMDTTMLFTANMVGRFPVERHGTSGGESAVLYIEVLP